MSLNDVLNIHAAQCKIASKKRHFTLKKGVNQAKKEYKNGKKRTLKTNNRVDNSNAVWKNRGTFLNPIAHFFEDVLTRSSYKLVCEKRLRIEISYCGFIFNL